MLIVSIHLIVYYTIIKHKYELQNIIQVSFLPRMTIICYKLNFFYHTISNCIAPNEVLDHMLFRHVQFKFKINKCNVLIKK